MEFLRKSILDNVFKTHGTGRGVTYQTQIFLWKLFIVARVVHAGSRRETCLVSVVG